MKLDLAIALAAICGFAIFGCAKTPPSDSAVETGSTKTTVPAPRVATLGTEVQAEHYSVLLTLQPKEVKAGKTKLLASVRHHGMPSTDATVKVALSMPGMGMGGPAVELRHSKDGEYAGVAELGMGGAWQANVSVSNPEGHANEFVYEFVALQE